MSKFVRFSVACAALVFAFAAGAVPRSEGLVDLTSPDSSKVTDAKPIA